MPYDALRQARVPDEDLKQFLLSTYDAAVLERAGRAIAAIQL
jgi:hypothetical protein